MIFRVKKKTFFNQGYGLVRVVLSRSSSEGSCAFFENSKMLKSGVCGVQERSPVPPPIVPKLGSELKITALAQDAYPNQVTP